MAFPNIPSIPLPSWLPKSSSRPIPNTLSRTSHAVTISVDGQAIGMIQSWGPNQARATAPVYEINSIGDGTMLERCPMVLSGTTINVTRVDLYKRPMEKAWGNYFDINLLTDQHNHIKIKEKWSNPDGSQMINMYEGCWFSSLGRVLVADGDKIVRVNATIDFVRVTKYVL